jgi:hypothetical protein
MPFKMDFTINHANPGFGVTVGRQVGPRPTIMNAGVLPFFAFSVLYDARNDAIGLKLRSLPRSTTGLHAEIASAGVSRR